MIEILRIGLFSSDENYDKLINFQSKKIQIKNIGTNGDVGLLKTLVKDFDGRVDVICLSSFPCQIRIKGKLFIHPDVEEIKSLTTKTPVVDGHILRDIYFPWSVRRIASNYPDVLKNKRIGFPSGAVHYSFIREVEEQSDRLFFADPYFILGVPKLIRSSKQLERFLSVTKLFISKIKMSSMAGRSFRETTIKKNPFLKDFAKCDVYFCNQTQFDFIDFDNLDGKTIITDFLSEEKKEKLFNCGVHRILCCSPNVVDLPEMSFAILEGIFQSFKDDRAPLTSKEIFDWIELLDLSPQVKESLNPYQKGEKRKFGFILHPLSRDYLLKVPGLNLFQKSPSIAKLAERTTPYLPGFKFGKISGIESEATGVKVDCDLYLVLETPKEMMRKNKNKMYDKLVKITYQAEKSDNKMIGLGAYTKIVGDAGVTIANRSPLPVTTGNSLSSAATLWAADFAVKKMNLVERKSDVYQGTLMIVGATGSIGKVSAKVLCRTWKKIVLVAPKPYKLIDVAEEVKEINPICDVVYSTNANEFASECDLIITTTSAQGKKIIDINEIKSGCVVCDVSRPFDISKEDAISRPDILVIASGEVELPGRVQVNRDIGLHGNVVYACLAETALLTMEGRYEPFSLSRDLSYKKVIEIDRMARKHGVKLAAVMGHDQEITVGEIELCRSHALENRSKK